MSALNDPAWLTIAIVLLCIVLAACVLDIGRLHHKQHELTKRVDLLGGHGRHRHSEGVGVEK